ncbi:8-oxoguanine DNA glycosylase OGG fold protein [Aureibaculum conchae]|uniref:8-oxoguanine DNA glycosylase OGG fold protein n=1 Tax=Aureibaculum sp. 2308TA14-22 TaxID=3108392 RepID=UPI0033929595
MNISKYIEQIRVLEPFNQSKFKYNTEKWKKLNPTYKHYITDFENIDISRKDIIDAFKEFYENGRLWEKPFLLTMIWGFADTGYGTYRTNKYLDTLANHELIINSFSYIQKNELENAYNTLKQIKGLNVSYISKIMYFATRALGLNDYFLIYDIRVAKSLILLTSTPEIAEIIEVYPSSKFKHYQIYNNLIHNISRQNDIESDALEMFLFEQKF